MHWNSIGGNEQGWPCVTDEHHPGHRLWEEDGSGGPAEAVCGEERCWELCTGSVCASGQGSTQEPR